MINLPTILKALPTTNHDIQRISLFTAAVSQKAVELSVSNPLRVPDFVRDSAVLMSKWMDKTRRLSLADLFRDPYKELRNETRGFAAKWDLDPFFRDLMG